MFCQITGYILKVLRTGLNFLFPNSFYNKLKKARNNGVSYYWEKGFHLVGYFNQLSNTF